MRVRAPVPRPSHSIFPVRATVAARCITCGGTPRASPHRAPAASAPHAHTRATSRPLRNARAPREPIAPHATRPVTRDQCAGSGRTSIGAERRRRPRRTGAWKAGGANADVSCASKLEREERASCASALRGLHPARPLQLDTLHTALYTVGHEKSCPIAGCPYQRTRGNFHLFGSRGHTALADDRRAVRP